MNTFRIVRFALAATLLLSANRTVFAGPFLVADINTHSDDSLSSNPKNFVVARNLAYFTAASGLGPSDIAQPTDADGKVTVDEIIAPIANALHGCFAEPL